MTAIGLLVLFALIRAYYRRKWEGSRPGAKLDLGWVLNRVRPEVGVGTTIIECRYQKPYLVFLTQRDDALEWHYYAHSVRQGWFRASAPHSRNIA